MLQITEREAREFQQSDKWKVEREGDCLIWKGHMNDNGYGYIRKNNHSYLAHRIAFVAAHYEIPDLVVDHTCRNRACVNPEHLVALTIGENIMQEGSQSIQRRNSLKTHCKAGHPLTHNNLRPANLKRGQRECIICSRARARKAYRKRRNLILTAQMNANENLTMTD